MKLLRYQTSSLKFVYPDYCNIQVQSRVDYEHLIVINPLLDHAAAGRIEVAITAKNNSVSPASIAFEHRRRLLVQRVSIKDSSLIPSPVPERFETAWFYWPIAAFNDTEIDAPLLIYETPLCFLHLALVGPGEGTLAPLWKLNQSAFVSIRDSVRLVK